MIKKNTLLGDMGKKLRIYILLIVIIPLIIINLVEYLFLSEKLSEETLAQLTQMLTIQNEQSSHYFNHLLQSMLFESQSHNNIAFLENLIQAYRETEKKNHKITQTISTYKQSEENNYWNKVRFDLDIEDILFINDKGNVLFSNQKKIPPGSNLLLSDKQLATAIETAFQTQQTTFSDLFFYPPASKISGFFIKTIQNLSGERIGAMIFQITTKQLNKILIKSDKNSMNSYLLGSDLIARIHSKNHPELRNEFHNINNSKTQTWWNNHVDNHSITHNETQIINYKNEKNQSILIALKAIQIADKVWAVAVEIEEQESFSIIRQLLYIIFILISACILFILLIVIFLTRKIVHPLTLLSSGINAASKGNFDVQVTLEQNDEMGRLVKGFNTMVESLKNQKKQAEDKVWLETGIGQLNDVLRGEQNIYELSRHIISFLCQYIKAQVGIFYLCQDTKIKLTGSYAFKNRKNFCTEYQEGEGIIGQAVIEKQYFTLTDLPDEYMNIQSGLGYSTPKVLSVYPVIWNEKVVAVMEFASLNSFSALSEQLLHNCNAIIASGIKTTLSRDETNSLLEKTQMQAEALQTREEELRENNAILEAQSLKLEKSATEMEEKNVILQSQQEALKLSNEALERKAQELASSQTQLEEKNESLNLVRKTLEEKARDLEISSKYKSEFLANMSHELRTPLNSLLILSSMLSKNKDNNLTAKQIEYAQTIHDSGTDLLNLINDILDLSKIEAGRMDVTIESIHLNHFSDDMQRMFQAIADKKGIALKIDNQLNDMSIHSDPHKLAQIIKNLLSNALKFTEQGSITLRFTTPLPSLLSSPDISNDFIQLAVIDTGIGIPVDKQKAIFEAFQQADGTTNRKYGGTGLGLSISRELAQLLGGYIRLVSEPNKGSTFYVLIKRHLVLDEKKQPETTTAASISINDTVSTSMQIASSTSSKASTPPPQSTPPEPDNIPLAIEPAPLNTIQATATKSNQSKTQKETKEIKDDRNNITAEDRSVLIIEDDPDFASILAELAKEKGFKILVASDGETGLHFADYYQPSGIILDIGLPKMDGWQVMERLKNNFDTRHIPVHFMSGQDKTNDAFRCGAMGYLIKPVSIEMMEDTFAQLEDFLDHPVKHLLIVEDNKVQREFITDFVSNGNKHVHIDVAETAQQTIDLMHNQKYDCIVLDLGLPDMNGVELLEIIRNNNTINETPIIIYSAKELDSKEKVLIHQYANQLIIKSPRSPDILFDNIALFLHQVGSSMPEDKQHLIRMLHDNEAIFNNRHILVVDDDMRNVFALTTMLRDKNVIVETAMNGLEALKKLEQMKHPPDLILMDIMMPEMDGYEAMQKIRELAPYQSLPIIALTAKAMKGERIKCIEAGANDYLSKPIDTDKLLSMMRVWLYH